MKYAFISFALWQRAERPLLKAIVFERKEKNTFGLFINQSIATSAYYEDLLFHLIDGKYTITYVDDEANEQNEIFEYNYPFENIKQYIGKFNKLPVKVNYFEQYVNTFAEVNEIIERFSDTPMQSVNYIDTFQYSKLLKKGKLIQQPVCEEVDLEQKIRRILSEDIAEISFTIENEYQTMGLQNIPLQFLMKLKSFYDELIDFAQSPFQMSKANIAFVNNCIKTTIHLPKTEQVNEKINNFSNKVSKITRDKIHDVEVESANYSLYTSIIELMKNTDIKDLKIDIGGTDTSIEISKKVAIDLEKKVSIFKEQINNAEKTEFVKYVIPYEINTYNNSFMALDENMKHFTYYVGEESFNELWVVKDKIIQMNAKELEKVLLEDKDISFKTFKQHWISVEGKYRSRSTADVSKIQYVIASDIQ